MQRRHAALVAGQRLLFVTLNERMHARQVAAAGCLEDRLRALGCWSRLARRPHARACDDRVRRSVGPDSALGQRGDWTQPFKPCSKLCRLRVLALPRICSCTRG